MVVMKDHGKKVGSLALVLSAGVTAQSTKAFLWMDAPMGMAGSNGRRARYMMEIGTLESCTDKEPLFADIDMWKVMGSSGETAYAITMATGSTRSNSEKSFGSST